MQKGIKFRAYPTKEQQNLINRTLGCCRLVYNKGLAMRNDAYSNGEKTGYNQTSAMVTELKKSDEFAFLKQVDSIALAIKTHWLRTLLSAHGNALGAAQNTTGILMQV